MGSYNKMYVMLLKILNCIKSFKKSEYFFSFDNSTTSQSQVGQVSFYNQYISPVDSPHKGQWHIALIFLCSAPEQTVEPTIEASVIWDAIAPITTSLDACSTHQFLLSIWTWNIWFTEYVLTLVICSPELIFQISNVAAINCESYLM